MHVTKKLSCRVIFFLAVSRVIFFAVNVCDGLTRLTAKKNLLDQMIFLLHAFTAKKNTRITTYTPHPGTKSRSAKFPRPLAPRPTRTPNTPQSPQFEGLAFDGQARLGSQTRIVHDFFSCSRATSVSVGKCGKEINLTQQIG